jgi:hypothetical protein
MPFNTAENREVARTFEQMNVNQFNHERRQYQVIEPFNMPKMSGGSHYIEDKDKDLEGYGYLEGVLTPTTTLGGSGLGVHGVFIKDDGRKFKRTYNKKKSRAQSKGKGIFSDIIKTGSNLLNVAGMGSVPPNTTLGKKQADETIGEMSGYLGQGMTGGNIINDIGEVGTEGADTIGSLFGLGRKKRQAKKLTGKGPLGDVMGLAADTLGSIGLGSKKRTKKMTGKGPLGDVMGLAADTLGSIGLGSKAVPGASGKKKRQSKKQIGGALDLGPFNFLNSMGSIIGKTQADTRFAPLDAMGLGKKTTKGGRKLQERSTMQPMIAAGAPKKTNTRHELVKKIMKEKGLKMIDASKYIKANNLY